MSKVLERDSAKSLVETIRAQFSWLDFLCGKSNYLYKIHNVHVYNPPSQIQPYEFVDVMSFMFNNYVFNENYKDVTYEYL